jgi:L-fucose isomerase-like protein
MEGKCVSIEGDVDGAIQSLVGSYLGIGPGFLTDWLEHDRSSISLWHPGMASLGHLPRHWQRTWIYLGRYFSGAKPFVVEGQLKSDQPVTITRLWRWITNTT